MLIFDETFSTTIMHELAEKLTLEEGSLTSPTAAAVAGGSLDPTLEHLQTITIDRMKLQQIRVSTPPTFNSNVFLYNC